MGLFKPFFSSALNYCRLVGPSCTCLDGGRNEAALRGATEHLAGLGGGISAFNDITKGALCTALYDLVKQQTREVRA